MTNKNTNLHRTDLKKQNSIRDYFFFNGYNFDAFMILMLFITILFLTIMAVSAAPNPSVLFGV
jgi:hypothetical protein